MTTLQSCFNARIEAYLAHRISMGYAPDTYSHLLGKLDVFCCTNFPNETKLTREVVDLWLTRQDGESVNSHRRRATAIRGFGRYLQSTGQDAYIAPPKVTAKMTRYIPYIFNEQELSDLFRNADSFAPSKSDPLAHYIVPTLLRVIYCCGLRPSEGRLIKTADVNLEKGMLHIQEAKRHRERIVMLSDDLLALCRAYNYILKSVCGDTLYFFPKPGGQPRGKQWLSYQLKRCLKGIELSTLSAASPRVYDFRHTFATRKLHDWLDQGVDLYTWLPYLSAYLGHRQFSSTAYYIHLLPERLRSSPNINLQAYAALLPEAPT